MPRPGLWARQGAHSSAQAQDARYFHQGSQAPNLEQSHVLDGASLKQFNDLNGTSLKQSHLAYLILREPKIFYFFLVNPILLFYHNFNPKIFKHWICVFFVVL